MPVPSRSPSPAPKGATADDAAPSAWSASAFAPSGLAPLAPDGAAPQSADRGLWSQAVLPFDACHIGVVLRAVLFVHAVLAVAVAFGDPSPLAWLGRFGLTASVALPATLLWLVVACSLKRPLSRLSDAWQWLAASTLGVLCGVYSWWLARLLGIRDGAALLDAQILPVALAGAGFSAALFYALKLRAHSQLPAATTARLAELQSRIRPHFLFNTLNSAIALVRIDPARAEAVLEDLAELFRVALQEVKGHVTLADEVELARRYLAIEQVRFGERLQVQWDIDPAAGKARLPPLVLQPLVENAVKHGIEPSPQGGRVLVRTSVHGAQAVIVIANTLPEGPWRGGTRRGHGMALQNTRARLRLLHDVAATFHAGARGGYFRVKIIVPL